MKELDEEKILQIITTHAKYTKSKVFYPNEGKTYDVSEVLKRIYKIIH